MSAARRAPARPRSSRLSSSPRARRFWWPAAPATTACATPVRRGPGATQRSAATCEPGRAGLPASPSRGPPPKADASIATVLLSPSGEAFEAFYDTELMSDFSDAVIVEGDDPLGHSDLDVFVAPAPEAGETLFVRQERDPAAADRARADAWETLLR